MAEGVCIHLAKVNADNEGLPGRDRLCVACHDLPRRWVPEICMVVRVRHHSALLTSCSLQDGVVLWPHAAPLALPRVRHVAWPAALLPDALVELRLDGFKLQVADLNSSILLLHHAGPLLAEGGLHDVMCHHCAPRPTP